MHLKVCSSDSLEDLKNAQAIISSWILRSHKPIPKDDSIENLELSAFPHNALIRSGITSISHLIGMYESELSFIDGMGKKSIEEIKHQLSIRGLKLGS